MNQCKWVRTLGLGSASMGLQYFSKSNMTGISLSTGRMMISSFDLTWLGIFHILAVYLSNLLIVGDSPHMWSSAGIQLGAIA